MNKNYTCSYSQQALRANQLQSRDDQSKQAAPGNDKRGTYACGRHRIWRYILIAVGLTIYAQLGQAQEDVQPTQPIQIENETPPNELPVITAESDEVTKVSEQDQTESTQREIQDLIAQQGMDAAAQRMADYAFWQTLLIFIGTIVLVWTLMQTRRANKLLAEANEDLRLRGENSTKAYVSGSKCSVRMPKSSKESYVFNITLKNDGGTPALKVFIAGPEAHSKHELVAHWDKYWGELGLHSGE